jgi:hypothetical protein
MIMKFPTDTTEYCHWLHDALEELPMIRCPFDINILPLNGIYFFYQQGELWGHGGKIPKIVRIGTHRDGNFKSRIKEHFLLNESKMNFDRMRAKPADRSIFRKNIGRALLNKENEDYLKIWEIDFTTRQNRERYNSLRDINKEKNIESHITKILRQQFSFRFINVDNQIERMGDKGLESSLIGTVSHCKLCKPSNSWLGGFSPKKEIKTSGLWLVQHIGSKGINNQDKETISNAIGRTKEWITNSS